MADHARSRTDLPRHARVHRPPRRGPVLVLTAALVGVASTAGAAYWDLRSQLDVSDAQDLVVAQPATTATPPPDDPFAGLAMNVLVMGTDLRDEENAALAGYTDGMRSDTTMLVHVSGDRSWVEVVSIPRDSYVQVPECLLPDGSRSQPAREKFNEAFSIGAGGTQEIAHAAACTIGTVQALTGVTVTHHLVVRMTGVIEVVDALGGVRMCLPEAVDEDPRYGDLHLGPGDQKLGGQDAIGFLRVRKGTGMGLHLGSDLGRIERQQAFVQAAVREVLGKDVLADADELYRVARAALGALTADPELADPVRLASFAYSLRDLDRARVVFTELPVRDDPQNDARVLWNPEADEIWQRLATDTPPASIAPVDAGTTGVGTGGTGGGADGGDAGDAGQAPGAGGADGTGAGSDVGGGVLPPGGDAATTPEGELLPGVCAT